MKLFDSKYVIDGVSMDFTPAQLLAFEDLTHKASPQGNNAEEQDIITDETLDMPPGGYPFEEGMMEEYLNAVKNTESSIQIAYAGLSARCQLAYDLIDTLWAGGHFVLEDIQLHAQFKWEQGGLGQSAALYNAAEQVNDLCTELDLPIVSRTFSYGTPSVRFDAIGIEKIGKVSQRLVAKADTYLVYVPFDTDSFHLGGSTLSAALGIKGGTAPKMEDPVYFMDCYEVLREMSEDGILLSGVTVGHGGIALALDKLCAHQATDKGFVSNLCSDDGKILKENGSLGTGKSAESQVCIKVDISDLLRAYPSSDACRVLFSEVPGAIIQIEASDLDYVDVELLLQDVMYFPLGRVMSLEEVDDTYALCTANDSFGLYADDIVCASDRIWSVFADYKKIL